MNRDDEILGDALALPPGERAAFLDRTCAGDPALRARLASLLPGLATAGHTREGAPASSAALSSAEDRPGGTIGRYTLLKKIGEGGCGIVYLAAQNEPVRRQVALKIIKLGMDTREVVTRFEAERQALALMDHPDIARVFDAGATASGRPFFVMEFVDGTPITRFCDEHAVPTAARLELFARVCLALQHAHQKGVIHRDLKPSNILVELRDGVPTPKVIDFGIAKATAGPLSAHTLLTSLEQFVGTPAYMSPEQVERRDLDTRSDIYALGVLLYELLTGRPPFDPQTLLHAGVEEVRRIIREIEPPRPSARLATLTAADRATVARHRGAAPMQLSLTLRGDLDWIVMRCLEKDRDRRYGTAHELADDVRRHLRSEPVAARPPSPGYRARKFVARHRLACVSTAIIALALLLSATVSISQAVRALRAERLAVAGRDAAQAATRAESAARAVAQRRQEDSEELLAFMLGDFRAGLEKIGRLQFLDAVGDQALAYFAALAPRDLTDTALTSQARALTQIGEVRLAEARYADATEAFASAYHRAAALATRYPKNGDALFERAQAEYWIGFAGRRRGDFATCREWFTRYRDSTLALAALEGPTTRARTEVSYGHHNLAILDLDRGDLAAARTGFLAERDAVTTLLAANPPDNQLRYRLADIASWLGTIAERDGRYPEALEHYHEMAVRTEELLAREPAVAFWKKRVADSLVFIANVEQRLGRGASSLTAQLRAEAALQALVAQDPNNRQWLLALLNAQLNRIALLAHSANAAPAALLLEQVQSQLEAFTRKEPSSQLASSYLAKARRIDAALRFAAHRPGAAEAIAQALEREEKLVGNSRADAWTYSYLAQSCILAGRIAADNGQVDIAQRHWLRAVEVLSPYREDSNDWRFLDPVAQALTLLGRTDEARPLVERLRRFGYHSLDPFATPILDVVKLPPSPAQP